MIPEMKISNVLFNFFAPQMKLADMGMRLESARLLTWKAAMLKDAGLPYTKVIYTLPEVTRWLILFLCNS